MNMQDKIDKGRCNSPRGEAHGSAKLTRKKVMEIKMLLRQGVITQALIAKMYGVSDSGISEIKRGKRWGDVT